MIEHDPDPDLERMRAEHVRRARVVVWLIFSLIAAGFITVCGALVSGCSSLIDPPRGVSVDCLVVEDECPPQSLVVLAAEHYATRTTFDARADLVVSWYDRGTVFWTTADGLKVHSFTEDGRSVSTSTCAGFVHELRHVDLFRDTGDGDANHEKPPGGWRTVDNTMIEELEGEICNG